MIKCKFALSGCDDATEMELDLTEEELVFLRKVSALSQATSTYGCQPTLIIRKEEAAPQGGKEET